MPYPPPNTQRNRLSIRPPTTAHKDFQAGLPQAGEHRTACTRSADSHRESFGSIDIIQTGEERHYVNSLAAFRRDLTGGPGSLQGATHRDTAIVPPLVSEAR